MTEHDDDLELKTLWQSTPPVDLDELLSHVDNERRRIRNFLWFETAGTVLGIACIWIYFKVGLFTSPFFGIALTIAAIASQAWMWSWRRDQWNAVSQAPLDLLELQLKRARTTLRLGYYYVSCSPIGIVFGFMVATFSKIERNPFDFAPLTRLMIFVGLIAMLLGLTWLGARMIRRSRSQIATLEPRIRALRNGDH